MYSRYFLVDFHYQIPSHFFFRGVLGIISVNQCPLLVGSISGRPSFSPRKDIQGQLSHRGWGEKSSGCERGGGE